MKNAFLLFVVIIALASCKKDPAINAKKESNTLTYNSSYNAWLVYKNKVNNSYSYTTTWGSVFGYGGELKTTVVNGKIVARDYVAYRYESNNTQKDTIKQWHEDQSTINTHPNDATVAMTMDDVYSKAKSVWLKADPKSNDIFFETANDGLISSCGYVPKGCQDDCFNGIHISTVSSL